MEYHHEVNEQQINDFNKMKVEDNFEVVEFLEEYTDDVEKFNSCLFHLGQLIQIVSIQLKFKQNIIKKIFEENSEKSIKRKMKNIMKDLNESINLRYNFAEDVEIVTDLYFIDNQGFVLLNKILFLGLISNNELIIDEVQNI